MNHYISLQTPYKRFIAGLIDVVIVILLAIFIWAPVARIAYQGPLGNITGEIVLRSVDSHLYVWNPDGNGGYAELSKPETFPEAIYRFYVDEIPVIAGGDGAVHRGYAPILVEGKEHNTTGDYYNVILLQGSENTLFDFSNIDPQYPWNVPGKTGKEAEITAFYASELNIAYHRLDANDLIQRLIADYYTWFIGVILVSYALAALIIVVIIPLFRKDQLSIGKVMTKSIVVNSLGFKMTKMQGIMRNLGVFLFSYVFFTLPIHVASYFVMFFDRHKRRSLFDRLSATLVCDRTSTLTFDNIDEETRYRKDLAQRLILIEKRKAENRAEKPISTDHLNPKD